MKMRLSKGLKPLQPELDRIAALSSKNQLTDLLAHYQMINVGAFFGYGEQQDFKDARKQIAIVDQAGLGLPERDYYFRTDADADKTRKQYVQHVMKMLKLMGEHDAQSAGDAQKIMNLETALAKASMDVTSRRQPKNIYHPMPTVQLAGLTPAIEWPKLFSDTGVPGVAELMSQSGFLQGPAIRVGLDRSRNHPGLPALATHRLNPEMGLPKALRRRTFQLHGKELRGQPQQRVRWKRCVRATDGALGEALGQVYVEKQFPSPAKPPTLQMVHDIENAMGHEIDTLTWMSPPTK